MKCTNENIGRQLGDYATGHLRADETSQVKAHLGKCEHCRANLDTMRLISAFGADKNKHLTTELITRYYQDRNTLPVAVVEKIETHLGECDQCAYDLDFLKSMENELAASVRTELNRAPAWQIALESVGALFQKPALAYFLLLLTIYPAVSWLTDSPAGSDSSTSAWSSSRAYEIAEARRSTGDMTVITRSTDNQLLRLDLPIYHLLEDKRYEYSMTYVASGHPVELDKIVNYDSKGILRLLLNTNRLTDGEYQLLVTETDRADSLDYSDSYFQFRLITEP